MVVIEAASHGTPSVLVAGEDNAALELIEDGVNGFVAPSCRPEALAAAIMQVAAAGPALRLSTTDWFRRRAPELSLKSSVEIVTRAYASG
jgi:glycosyltransferase involved in cell wall biosynthesis